MKRDTVNFLLNIVSFFILLGLAISGIIIALPHKHGPNEGTILGMGRGQWGDTHLWIGIIFATLMLAHLILHWDWIKRYARSAFGKADKQGGE
jgi:hypothetical protein